VAIAAAFFRFPRQPVGAEPTVGVSARKPYREPHCIAGKLHAWRFSGIREYCFDPLRWPGNAAVRLSHNCAQHCSPMQRILRKFFLGSFEGTRANCSRALAYRRTVFEVVCRKPLQQFLFALEQHSSARQKLGRRRVLSLRQLLFATSRPPEYVDFHYRC